MFDDYASKPKREIAETLITYFIRHQALSLFLQAPDVYARWMMWFRRGLITKRELVERIESYQFYVNMEGTYAS